MDPRGIRTQNQGYAEAGYLLCMHQLWVPSTSRILHSCPVIERRAHRMHQYRKGILSCIKIKTTTELKERRPLVC